MTLSFIIHMCIEWLWTHGCGRLFCIFSCTSEAVGFESKFNEKQNRSRWKPILMSWLFNKIGQNMTSGELSTPRGRARHSRTSQAIWPNQRYTRQMVQGYKIHITKLRRPVVRDRQGQCFQEEMVRRQYQMTRRAEMLITPRLPDRFSTGDPYPHAHRLHH